MDNTRTRRFLIVAFALSLLIHLVLTGVIHWTFAPENDVVQIVRIEHLHTTRIAHIPSPPPHTPAPAPRVPVHVAKATAVNPNASLTERRIITGPTQSPAPPTPAATATPNCATNDTTVQMIASPPPPDISPAARGDQTNGITRVRVIVNPQGSIESTAVIGSSGNSSLDQVAIAMARQAQYAPATHACKAVASDYTYAVKFTAW